MKQKKVLAGMSGGVDSSVAAALLKEEGYDVTGVFMKIWDERTPCSKTFSKHACYSPWGKDIEDIKKVAGILDIKLLVIDLAEEYKDIVLGYFRKEYKEGRTPNPCVICNRFLKFGLLPERAALSAGFSFDFLATGHYAFTGHNGRTGRYFLKKGADKNKDQSYFLFMLTQQQLSRLILPLGGYTKKQVRSLAKKYRLPVENKEESQDFLSGDRTFLFGGGVEAGPVTDKNGNILGRHQGIVNYTVGQRKGLGIAAGRPLYVTGIDAGKNTVILGEKKDVYKKTLTAGSLNLVSIQKISAPMKVEAKVRYKHAAASAVIDKPDSKGMFSVLFDKPQWAVTPGQAVVFYKKDILLGGGFIANSL
ncbi:MAG: tRNA 2-thiouridine(34) synthase MnmA [Candidatus Omnitrophica bacterium]|nr:tRNA 2-thiouridine(34) synthase MnmA [Candidatus Omnitrophota bacterium]